MSRYINVGRQLPVTYRMTLDQWRAQDRHASESMKRVLYGLVAEGAQMGFHDEMIVSEADAKSAQLWVKKTMRSGDDQIHPLREIMTSTPLWSDDALARLLSDVRQAENLPIVKPSAPNSGREKVLISDVKQGDQVFRFGDRTPSTVLYAHSCRWFSSLLVCCDDEPPFLIQRHKGAYIYRVTK